MLDRHPFYSIGIGGVGSRIWAHIVVVIWLAQCYTTKRLAMAICTLHTTKWPELEIDRGFFESPPDCYLCKVLLPLPRCFWFMTPSKRDRAKPRTDAVQFFVPLIRVWKKNVTIGDEKPKKGVKYVEHVGDLSFLTYCVVLDLYKFRIRGEHPKYWKNIPRM